LYKTMFITNPFLLRIGYLKLVVPFLDILCAIIVRLPGKGIVVVTHASKYYKLLFIIFWLHSFSFWLCNESLVYYWRRLKSRRPETRNPNQGSCFSKCDRCLIVYYCCELHGVELWLQINKIKSNKSAKCETCVKIKVR